MQTGIAFGMRFGSSWFFRHWSRSRKSDFPACPNPCETGRARLPDGVRVYAIGNIHGMSTLVTSLFNLICEDAKKSGEHQHTVMVFCGDYIDHGPDSAGVLSILSGLAKYRIEAVTLRGDHEDLFQRFMDQPARFGPRWMAGGGRQMLHSYGVAEPSGSPESYIQTSAALWRCMPVSHVNFLMELKTSYTLGDYFFCHAGARPGVPLDKQQPKDMIWSDDMFTATDHAFEKVIVHGDHAQPQPVIARHRIGIDTNAHAGGHLTAAVLENADCRFLQVAR